MWSRYEPRPSFNISSYRGKQQNTFQTENNSQQYTSNWNMEDHAKKKLEGLLSSIQNFIVEASAVEYKRCENAEEVRMKGKAVEIA